MTQSNCVMVIAPHPDDEAIGCGGTICVQLSRGHRVVVVFLTSGELGLKSFSREEAWSIREQEAKNAAEVLGISEILFLRLPDFYLNANIDVAADALRPIMFRELPLCVYAPHERESHPDHQVSVSIVRRALRAEAEPHPRILGYEVWTPMENYDHVEDISSLWAIKLRAVGCYKSQLSGFKYDRAILGLNAYRGELAAKCRYAEVFHYV